MRLLTKTEFVWKYPALEHKFLIQFPLIFGIPQIFQDNFCSFRFPGTKILKFFFRLTSTLLLFFLIVATHFVGNISVFNWIFFCSQFWQINIIMPESWRWYRSKSRLARKINNWKCFSFEIRFSTELSRFKFFWTLDWFPLFYSYFPYFNSNCWQFCQRNC